MPPNLPDARTAQRLLDVLSQLEHALRNSRHVGNAATGELEQRLTNLQYENQRLRSTRQEAATRLDTLLERMKEQLIEQNAAGQGELNLQEDAA